MANHALHDVSPGIERQPDWQTALRPAPTAGARSSRRRRLRNLAWSLLPPLTFVAMVGVWAAAVSAFKVPAYLLPGPGSIFSRIISDAPMLWSHSVTTLTEILLGFGLTVVTAIPLGLLIALSRTAKQVVYPPVMLMQLVPKIAVAPLFLVWLGFGMESKVLLTVLMTFFPLLMASISGFQILDERLLYLTQSMGASRWRDVPLSAFPGGPTGNLLGHQDVGDDRCDRRHRRRVRRRQPRPWVRAAQGHRHDGHRARIRGAGRAHGDRHRDQLCGGIERMGDDALAAIEEHLTAQRRMSLRVRPTP